MQCVFFLLLLGHNSLPSSLINLVEAKAKLEIFIHKKWFPPSEHRSYKEVMGIENLGREEGGWTYWWLGLADAGGPAAAP